MADAYIIGDSRSVVVGQSQGVKGKDVSGFPNKDIKFAKPQKVFAMGEGRDGNYYSAAGATDIRFAGASEGCFKEHISRIKENKCTSIVIASGVNDLAPFLKQKDKDKNNQVAIKASKAKARAKAREYIELALKYQKETGLPICFVEVAKTYPDFYLGNDKYSPNIPIDEYNKEMEKLAKENGFTFIKTSDLVTQNSYPKTDSVHFNSKTGKLIAKRVDENLPVSNMAQQKTKKVSKGSAAKETQKTSKTEKTPAAKSQSTKNTMKTQADKSEIKAESAIAHIELENGKFTQRVRRDIVKKLTPIYGKENAKKIEVLALTNPNEIDKVLGITRSKASSKATLEHLLTLEGEDVAKVIEVANGRPIKTIEKETKSKSKTTKETANSVAKGSYCTRGGYKYKMPQEVAELTMGLLYEMEFDKSNHYLCANGLVTNIGVTYTYNKAEYEKTFGKETCNLLYKAENAVRNNKEIYYSLDGKTWHVAGKGSGAKGNYVMKILQRKTKGGQTLYISSQPGGRGDKIELKRVANAGFIIEKVNNKVVPVPDMCKSEDLNMRVMDEHYAAVKKIVSPSNWAKMTPQEKLNLAYSHYHNPSNANKAIRSSGLTRTLPVSKVSAASTTATTHKVEVSKKNIEKGRKATTATPNNRQVSISGKSR